jgi:hypothetical protein
MKRLLTLFLLIAATGWAAELPPYVRNVLDTNAVTLGAGLSLSGGNVLSASTTLTNGVDVLLAGLAEGQVLFWNDTIKKWTNGTVAISDVAFAVSWNGLTGAAPSKNAVYDYLHILSPSDNGKAGVLDQGTGIANTGSGGALLTPITTSAGLAAVLSDETGSGPDVFANGPALGSVTVQSNLNAATIVGTNTIQGQAGLNLTTTLTVGGQITATNLTASRAVVTDGSKGLSSATGTADTTTYLRGDGTYAASSGLTNNLATTAYADQGTNGVPRHLYQGLFPNTRKAMAALAPVDFAGLGDSYNVLLYGPMQQRFQDNWGGYAGATGGQGDTYNNWIVGGGAYLTNSMVNGDYSWFGTYAVLPSSGAYVIMSNVAYASFTGNLFSAACIMESGAGTVKVQTNLNLGTFADTAVTATNLAQASTVGKVIYKFTNAVASGTQIKISHTGVGGSAKVVNMSILNRGTNGGVSYNQSSVAGTDIAQFRGVGTNRWGPIWADISPTLLTYVATDSTNLWQTNFLQFYQEFTNWCPHSDLLVGGIHPKQDDIASPSSNAAAQESVLRSVCMTNGIPFFSLWSLYKSFQQGTNDGLLRETNDVHSTTSGIQFEMDSMFAWLGLFNVTGGSKPTPNQPYYGGDLDMSRNGSTGQRQIMTGPFSQFAGGSLQWLHGTTNYYYSFTPIGGGAQWVWRNHAGGANVFTLKTVNGTTTLGRGQVGVPIQLGESTDPVDNVYANALTATGNVSLAASGGTVKINGGTNTFNTTNGWPIAGSVLKLYDGTNAAFSPNQVGNSIIIIEGDSMVQEVPLSWGVPFGMWLTNLYWQDSVLYVNYAQSGDMATNIPAEYLTQGKTKRPSTNYTGTVYYFPWAGVNDIKQTNSAQNIYDSLSNQWQAARADGMVVSAFTIPYFTAANGSNATVEAIRVSLNTKIRQDSTLYDYLFDMAAQITNVNTQLRDGLHLTDAENANLALMVYTNLPPRRTFLPQVGGRHQGPMTFEGLGSTLTQPEIAFWHSNPASPATIWYASPAQATNIAEWKNSSSNILASVSPSGVLQMRIAASATDCPVLASVFTQTADGTACTNISTAETSMLGTGVGSKTLPATFWQVGRQLMADFSGDYWTGASPLNTYVTVKLGSLVVCSNLFIPTASTTGGRWGSQVKITCRTNSASVGALVASGDFYHVSSAGARTTRGFTNMMTITDTTAAMAFDLTATNGATTTSFQSREGSLTFR